jgi:hypothetical protein
MMMKGPFRELIPVDTQVSIKVPKGLKINSVLLLVRGEKPQYSINDGKVTLAVPQIPDHEIVALDLTIT